jgi:predicted nucleotidyltransferase
MTAIEPTTERAARAFLHRVTRQYDVTGAILFGSRARGDYRSDSDADIAVLLAGEAGEFFGTQRALSDIAYDVLLDTNIRIQALPIWQAEWDHPDRYSNPCLLRNIRREGITL